MNDRRRWAGSRMHVLDWLDGGDFTSSLNAMLRPTGFLSPASGSRRPGGWAERDEARLGRDADSLIPAPLAAELLDWWLAVKPGANVPNWDLACQALHGGGKPALVLVEAKAHVGEFTHGAVGKRKGNPDNDARIGNAIDEARRALTPHDDHVGISRDRWYQVSNRVAFAWKLASMGVPTVLIYLGFTGDDGPGAIGAPLESDTHWRDLVCSTLQRDSILSAALWEREIDCGAAPLWLLTRTRTCLRRSQSRGSLLGFAIGDDGLPTDATFRADEDGEPSSGTDGGSG